MVDKGAYQPAILAVRMRAHLMLQMVAVLFEIAAVSGSECPLGQEWTDGLASDDAKLAKMAGLFRPVTYTNGHRAHKGFEIKDGKVRDLTGYAGNGDDGLHSGKGYSKLYKAGTSEDQRDGYPNYPASEGWHFSKCMYDCSHWQYDRVKDGVYESVLFAAGRLLLHRHRQAGDPGADGELGAELSKLPRGNVFGRY